MVIHKSGYLLNTDESPVCNDLCNLQFLNALLEVIFRIDKTSRNKMKTIKFTMLFDLFISLHLD